MQSGVMCCLPSRHGLADAHAPDTAHLFARQQMLSLLTLLPSLVTAPFSLHYDCDQLSLRGHNSRQSFRDFRLAC